MWSNDNVLGTEAIELMSSALEAAWAKLPLESKTETTRELLALRILSAFKHGERDPGELQAHALRATIKSVSVA